jgi:outer membrane lipoprotein carrier protein
MSRVSSVCGGLAVAALVLPCAATAQPTVSANTLAATLQARYDTIRDFSADFVQTYRGGILRTQTSEAGTVIVKKPGMMRWHYTTPETKEFVSDGERAYFYVPQDRQVLVNDLPPDDQLGTPALFLAGKGNITEDYDADYAEPPGGGTTALRLTPRAGDPEYEYLVLTLDATTLQIRALAVRDLQGGESTIVFSNLQENQGLTDTSFVFRIPRNVDVVTNGSFD